MRGILTFALCVLSAHCFSQSDSDVQASSFDPSLIIGIVIAVVVLVVIFFLLRKDDNK